jgi:hypothetical protein
LILLCATSEALAEGCADPEQTGKNDGKKDEAGV